MRTTHHLNELVVVIHFERACVSHDDTFVHEPALSKHDNYMIVKYLHDANKCSLHDEFEST